jgi:translocator protein
VTTPTRAHRLLALGGFLALAFATAGVGSLLQGGDVQGAYLALDRPGWAPPAWLFGPVWTVLYVLIGVAAWRVWDRAGARGGRVALTLWGLQLLLNAAWPGVFFGLGELAWALAVILALDLVVVATLVAFTRHDRVAGALLAPYLGWILFATALNASILLRA